MITTNFRGERPVVVTTAAGVKLRGFFSVTGAVDFAKQGRHRLVLLRDKGAWVIHAEYVKGVKVRKDAPTKKEL